MESSTITETTLARVVAAQGLRKTWVATQAGIDFGIFSKLLSGERRTSPYYAEKIAPVLRVPADILLNGSSPR